MFAKTGNVASGQRPALLLLINIYLFVIQNPSFKMMLLYIWWIWGFLQNEDDMSILFSFYEA